MKKLLSRVLIIILASSFFSGCKKDKGLPPILPPFESMTIDFNFFNLQYIGSSSITGGTKNITSDGLSNYQFSASVANFWNLLLTVNLAIPVTAFNKAIIVKPTNIGRNRWEWKFDVNTIGAVFKARLTGQIRETDIKWEMYISKEGKGAYPEFLWFEGTSMPDGKNGQWILNHSQQYQEPLLRIDWALENTTPGIIKYTYIRDFDDNRATDKFKGSNIEYGLTYNELNAYYNIHIYESTVLNAFVDINIGWSTVNHTGHVKAFYYYQDTIWHCWDSSGSDIICN